MFKGTSFHWPNCYCKVMAFQSVHGQYVCCTLSLYANQGFVLTYHLVPNIFSILLLSFELSLLFLARIKDSNLHLLNLTWTYHYDCCMVSSHIKVWFKAHVYDCWYYWYLSPSNISVSVPVLCLQFSVVHQKYIKLVGLLPVLSVNFPHLLLKSIILVVNGKTTTNPYHFGLAIVLHLYRCSSKDLLPWWHSEHDSNVLTILSCLPLFTRSTDMLTKYVWRWYA